MKKSRKKRQQLSACEVFFLWTINFLSIGFIVGTILTWMKIL